jgi:hypothetical protein
MKQILPIFFVGFLILGGIGAGGFSQTKSIISNVDEYDMVIITPNEFSSQIQSLINHKNSHKVPTILKTTEDIYLEFEGRDEPEQIKYFIKYALENWNIKYVLLIGGVIGNTKNWYIPVRYVELDDGTGRGTQYISDLYYADVYKNDNEFEDWDKNGDDIIAQWPGDKFDLYPDVFLGRLPCRNIEEVSTVVQKIISYENNAHGQSWFNKMVAIGGDTFPEYEGYEGETTCDYVTNYMQDFEIIKLYYSTGAITSSTEVINAINNGCGFLLTRAKGGTDRIRVPKSDGTEIIALHNDDIDELSNKDKYPVMVLGECQHGEFNKAKKKLRNHNDLFQDLFRQIINRINRFIELIQKKQGKEPIPQPVNTLNECIAWRLVNKKDGGGIAVLTNTHICFAAIGDINHNEIPDDVEMYGGQLAAEVFRVYSEENIDILGQIFGKTVENYVSAQPASLNKLHCKSVQEWILIGDPSLKIGGYD